MEIKKMKEWDFLLILENTSKKLTGDFKDWASLEKNLIKIVELNDFDGIIENNHKVLLNYVIELNLKNFNDVVFNKVYKNKDKWVATKLHNIVENYLSSSTVNIREEELKKVYELVPSQIKVLLIVNLLLKQKLKSFTKSLNENQKIVISKDEGFIIKNLSVIIKKIKEKNSIKISEDENPKVKDFCSFYFLLKGLSEFLGKPEIFENEFDFFKRRFLYLNKKFDLSKVNIEEMGDIKKHLLFLNIHEKINGVGLRAKTNKI